MSNPFNSSATMRRCTSRAAIVIAVAASIACSSCIGRFALTNKLLSWNRTVGNKFVNELVFFAFWVLPVYEVSALADVLVINSIEFWSGTNPVASASPRQIKGEHDNYLIEQDSHGYTITAASDGSKVRLNFCDDNDTWSVQLPDGSDLPVMTFIDERHVALPAPGGLTTVVTLDEGGLAAYEATASRAASPLACAR